jgi:hypothetical protein
MAEASPASLTWIKQPWQNAMCVNLMSVSDQSRLSFPTESSAASQPSDLHLMCDNPSIVMIGY